ncbi:MopE-related protein [Polyangium spumosum]|uniref:MAM domain-containing protein n=1 Tax=Polyangium spumosum TaxID=889282 RepID=A0A6N7PHE7_9BACT|nr:MopE-related protein [Polyangium spumosum]MRG91439.1 hypothetical protein [Polyangium spumosum]
MRNLTRARSIVGALSLVVGVAAFGCSGGGDPSTGSGGSGGGGGAGGAGGAGGSGGQGGSGGSAACNESESRPCYSGPAGTQGQGECKAGAETCVNGQWSACSGEVLPSPAEVCDGKDDDCNGQVDDAIPQITCGLGACSVTVDGCSEGDVPECAPLPAPSRTETCDGSDDNCDGQIDEGCTCVDGQTQPCYSGGAATKGVGACKDGTQTCAGGAWGACEGEVLPGPETCDDLDNDCDGTSDEELGQISCGAGACAKSVEACVNGVPQTCTPGMPSPETCNGVDDDCNLLIDDGLGTITCGVGACQKTVQACASGQTQVCVPGTGMNEICNGVDDNCNGQVDESNPGGGAACMTGQAGVCAAGMLVCANGTLGCQQTTQASAEACDGLDNNCNGAADEGNPGGGAMCSTGKPGVCANGVSTCMNGGILCNQTVQPSTEVCDGLDNNCNGAADEGNPGGGAICMTGQPGVCSGGTQQCQNGSLKCVQNVQPTGEACNGLDDNCNGTSDEGNPGGGAVCSTGLLGVCGPGTTQCQGGSVKCVQNVAASTEICDGKDNNCNGTTDEGNPGGGVACNVPGKFGVCVAGTTACTGGTTVCNQNTQPGTEVCDGLDNDCDGQVDEGNPGGGATCTTGLGGSCDAGTITCQSGVLSCKANTLPVTDTCDGIDNDCDGLIDENASATTLFTENFANNVKGWTLGTTWAIGPAVAGPPPSQGNPDPANDHTTTADDGVAGVVIGGNYSIAAATPYYYLTSPTMNTSGTGNLTLDFWRWLNSDYPNFVFNTIEVSINGGSTWTTLWSHPASVEIRDNVWTNIHHNLNAYKSTTMRIRFGYSIGSSFASAYEMSGWNIDDVVVRRCL